MGKVWWWLCQLGSNNVFLTFLVALSNIPLFIMVFSKCTYLCAELLRKVWKLWYASALITDETAQSGFKNCQHRLDLVSNDQVLISSCKISPEVIVLDVTSECFLKWKSILCLRNSNVVVTIAALVITGTSNSSLTELGTDSHSWRWESWDNKAKCWNSVVVFQSNQP